MCPGFGLLEKEGGTSLGPVRGRERDEVLQDFEPTPTEINESLSKHGPTGSLQKSHGEEDAQSWFVFNSLSGNPKGPVPEDVSAAGDLGQDRNTGWINTQRSVCTTQHNIRCSAGISTAKCF